MSNSKEVTLRQVESGGFIVIERGKNDYNSSLNVTAAFTNYEDLVAGLGELFGLKNNGIDVSFLKRKIDEGSHSKPG